jgi:hypothetical protein
MLRRGVRSLLHFAPATRHKGNISWQKTVAWRQLIRRLTICADDDHPFTRFSPVHEHLSISVPLLSIILRTSSRVESFVLMFSTRFDDTVACSREGNQPRLLRRERQICRALSGRTTGVASAGRHRRYVRCLVQK